MFGDYRTFWVNPKDGRHMMFGSDGGLYETFDGGMNVNHKYQIPLGEIYIVETDNSDPYNIYLGLQDHDAWKAPINSWSGQVGSEDWILYGLWDGMHTRVDKEDNRWVYITTQFGAHHRIDQLTGEREQNLIVGTYGRGAYVTDISLLNQLSDEFQNKEAILFEVESKPIKNFSDRANWGNYELSGSNHISTPNEEGGLSIYYQLKEVPNNATWIEIFNDKRQISDTLSLKKVAGLQKIQWQNIKATVGTYYIRLHTDAGIFQQETFLRPAPIWSVGRVE